MLIATKADAVPPNQRLNMNALLSGMCEGTVRKKLKDFPLSAKFVVAIRATRDIEVLVDGVLVQVVEGLCSATKKRRRVLMVDIPDRCPTPDTFRRWPGFTVPRFAPPQIEGGGNFGVPNLRLSQVLQDLVGDYPA
ncbi:MAG: YcjX family protein [Acetobacteraceae bacterium]|nr:YcjX family protein [Acetobacteraceae bacterium]